MGYTYRDTCILLILCDPGAHCRLFRQGPARSRLIYLYASTADCANRQNNVELFWRQKWRGAEPRLFPTSISAPLSDFGNRWFGALPPSVCSSKAIGPSKCLRYKSRT